MEGREQKKHSWWKWILMAFIAVALLYFAFRGVKWNDFVSGLQGCNFWWVGAAMVSSIVAFWVRGARWRLILLPLNPTISRRDCYDGVTTAYLTNFALPRAGELARCGIIAGTGKTSFEAALGSVVLERSIDLICDLIIVVAIVWFSWEQVGDFMTREIWGSAAERFQFSMVWFLIAAVALFAAVCIVLYRYRERLSRNRFFAKLFSVVRNAWDGLAAGFRSEHKWAFLFYTIALWTLYWSQSLFTVYAFPGVCDQSISISTGVAGLNGVDALFLMVVGSLGWIVPVQGGIGAYHFILSLACAAIYGIPQTEGVVFATISHESQALTMLVCGAITLITASVSGGYLKQKNTH